MDHRRKHIGYRSIAEGDHEAGKTGGPAPHPPGSRRSRLSALALVSLGLVVTFVGIMTVVHFSHVNNLHRASVKTSTSEPVVLRREGIEVGATDGAAAGAGASRGVAAGGGAAGAASSELGLGDMDDEYGSEDDGAAAAVGEDDDDGAGNDDPIDKGEKDYDGAANDQPIDKGDKDDDGAANDQPFDKGDRDDDGSANDQPIDKGDKDDDGATNDEPIDKGDKDDDGAANDEPIDKGDKDDDGAANDEPIDKGDKDDDGAANDEPIDKGEKDDDGSANDEPIDKGDKDDDGAANDHPIDKGDKDDDGAQNDTPGDLDEMYESDQEGDGAATTTAAAADGGADGAAAAASKAAAATAASSAAASATAAAGDAAAAGSAADESNPEEVDEVTDYDDDGDGDSSDLYVDVDPDADDYNADHDVDLRTMDKQQPQQTQGTQTQQTQTQQQQTKEQTQEKPEAKEKQLPQKQQQQHQPKVKPEAESGAVAAAAAAAAGVVVPADACGVLSRELLEQWSQNNTVLLTFTNSVMFRNFGPTWLHHVRQAGIKYWVLAVADNETARLVRSHGADHCFLVHENEIDDTAAVFKWGSRSWQLHTWQKVLVVRHVHHLGFHVINSDLDVVWLRNPLEHFLVKYTAPDYWVSMDPITTQNPIGDDGPEVGVSTHHYMNTGVYFLRQTPGGRALIDKWYDIRAEMQRSGFHDQDGLYNYLKEGGQDVDPGRRVTKVVDGKTALSQLPATLFQNGYSHCINQIHKLHGLQPFEVHFVWVWGGNAGKINRMREQMYYIDPPSYHSDGLFLSYDVTEIEEPADFNNWTDTEAMVQTHLRALDSQLTDTWHGLALAALLQRTVVLPKMKCFCIQNWFENPQCRLPGEPHTRFPLSPACPADYVFSMDALAALNVSGRHIAFREFSFLDNERTPPEVKERPLVVVARRGVSAALRDGDTLTIPAGLKSDALLAALKPFLEPQQQKEPQTATPPQPPKRLHFANPRLAFAGWSDPRVGADFETAVAGLAVRWCCRPDAVAKAHGVEVGHQLKLHAATEAGAEAKTTAQSEAVSRRLLQLR
ncbi:hypothetical protein PLESTB_000737400 [Pleodorina starrii]|uniref:Nucleotide-diphospho-sugar transferase domain-containing protein n=1 Tax=Pleodorina starrii TaxID=330485 RepID=A0A9W6F221_9CHLO|nr:hypothetical protein PLESTM_000186900 [Pleodorina starrii]GLC53369.1 hypothetical protein PLESTB_000737400 [Pleodorina starrii]GLC67161.1 hypothetical protein PLESTF_000523700 [Pleodorina starrii]